MSAFINRADLLSYLSHYDKADLAAIAECFGYQTVNTPERVVVAQPELPTPKREDPLQEPITALPPASALPQEYFYRLSSNEPSTLLPEPEAGEELMPQWVHDIEGQALDLNAPIRPLNYQVPPFIPLVAWAQLWSLLRELLSETHVLSRPDIPKLVKQLAKGEQLKRIPWQQQRVWSTQLIVVLDRSERLEGLSQDYDYVVQQLAQLRGRVGLEQRLIRGFPVDEVWLEGKSSEWRMPEAGTRLLILSDLGIYAPSAAGVASWLRWGRELQAAGCVAYALVPAPVRFIPQELTAYFRCISWDRFSAMRVLPYTEAPYERIRARQAYERQQLHYWLSFLAVSTEVAPSLMRALRYELAHAQPMDVGYELLAWNHELVEHTTTYLQIKTEYLAEYREQLLRYLTQHPHMAKALYELIKRYLVGECYLDYYQSIALLGQVAGMHKDAEYQEAERYLKQFILAVHQARENRKQLGLVFSGHYLLQHQANTQKQDKAYWSSLWAMLHQRLAEEGVRPEWLDDAAAHAFLNQSAQAQTYELYQQGEALYVATPQYRARLSNSGFAVASYVLARVETRLNSLIEECEAGQVDHRLGTERAVCLPLSGVERRLHVGGRCLTVEAVQRPAWAGAVSVGANGLAFAIEPTGVDEYGQYFDLVFQGIIQRFRYIPPTTFLMGSPADELERNTDETQHEVILTQGYWLADTTVTQALWTAVMGNNPSHFNRKQLPVENVSWDYAQSFLQRLSVVFPSLQVRLPTEAEWECACRAGTTTPFSCGANITPEQVNYDGNYPYAGGAKGWDREQTVAVKSLPANAWGLYEMHGNVWEWCEDWYGEYPAGVQLDPTGANSGELRVLRGGSWFSYGRLCRSAYRYRYTPDFRNNGFVGFRFALGQVSLGTGQVLPPSPALPPQGVKGAKEPVQQKSESILQRLWTRIRGKG